MPATAVRALAILVLSIAMPAKASAQLRVVQVHVTDYAHVPPPELAEAESAASEVYARFGVVLKWTLGPELRASTDDAVHLKVVILTAAMTTRRNAPDGVFGEAARVTRYAFIYNKRIVDHAQKTESDRTRVLGLVLAHEIGHLLLSEHSHSPYGLMCAEWHGRVLVIPDMMPAQAAEIRNALVRPERSVR